MKTNEYGRSMIEMLGVLAIIGVLSVGGIAGYSKAMNKYRVNKTMDQIMQTVAATRTLFYGHKTYAALGDTLIQKAHLLPDELENGGANPFGGTVKLEVANKTGTDKKAFSLKYTKIPEEACIDLVTQDWGKGARSGFVKITAGNKDFTSSPVSVTDAVSACTTDNTITWAFY